MAYTADTIRTYVPEVLEMLADTVRNSQYNEWELAEQVRSVPWRS